MPLLVILFIVSYGILTMLVFEQGQTIESQRSLIREMLKDSTQLAALKGKLARDDSKRPHDQASVQADQKDAGQYLQRRAIRRLRQKGRTQKDRKRTQNGPVNRLTPRRKFQESRRRI